MFGRSKKGEVYKGVTAYVGLPGSGKSYGLVEAAHREFLKEDPRPVFVNAGFNVTGAIAFRSFDEFLEIPDGSLVLWDELPLYVSARKWNDFPDGLLYRLTQIRKDGLELRYSTIDWGMVDKNVRNVTFWVWECEQVSARVLRRRLYPPEHRRQAKERPRRTELVRLKQDVLDRYDSFSKVATTQKQRGKSNDHTAEKWGGVDLSTPTLDDWVPVDERPAPPTADEVDRYLADLEAGLLEVVEPELEGALDPPPGVSVDLASAVAAAEAFGL